MPKPLSEQVIVITGASSGIGLATAKEAARRGAKVVFAARNAADLERAAEEIRRDGGDALPVAADVTDFEQVEALAHRAVEAYGRIDTWINGAAVSVYGTFKEVPLEEFRRVVDTILMGNVHGARAALPLLEETHGALICIGSVLSDRGVPLQGPYCAAKHALKGWLDSLRVELMHEGSKVRVTLVRPSSIDTPLFNKAKTYLGVMPQPIPPVYAPDIAADAILRAAEGNERDVYVGGAGKVLSLAERVSPKLLDLQLRRSGFRTQRTNWPKPADGPNNLYAPVEFDGGIHGDFVTGEKQRSRYDQLEAHSTAASFTGAAALAIGAVVSSRVSASRAVPALFALGALALTGKGVLSSTFES